MNGTHTLTFRLMNGEEIRVQWEGPENTKVKNWWVTGREVDTVVATFVPQQGSA